MLLVRDDPLVRKPLGSKFLQIIVELFPLLKDVAGDREGLLVSPPLAETGGEIDMEDDKDRVSSRAVWGGEIDICDEDEDDKEDVLEEETVMTEDEAAERDAWGSVTRITRVEPEISPRGGTTGLGSFMA